MPEKSVAQIAEELGEPRKTVEGWIKKGMPLEEPERSEWVASYKATSRWRPKTGHKTEEAVPDNILKLQTAKAYEELLWKKAKREREQIRAEVEKGKYIAVAASMEEKVRMAVEIRQAILSVARSWADRILNLTSPQEAEEVLTQMSYDILERLSGGAAA